MDLDADDNMNVEFNDDDCFESFGQSERLVDRLKDLIEGYGDGLDVIKEMIQNADDAGATIVKICLDLRNNNDWSKSLFTNALNEVQGESFWIFNNALFTDDDFENLVKLGCRHKTKKSGVIGKFGLGFNSVYNITDIPCIMSGEKLAIFDPNFKYLPKKYMRLDKPGVIIDLKHKQFLKKYNDQFQPYNNVFGCNVFEDYNTFEGTLLRLPFRKSTSEISNILYTQERAKQMIKILFDYRENLLLFTQNICKLEIYTLIDGQKPNEMIIQFSIEKSLVEIIQSHNVDINITSFCSEEQKHLVEQSNILNVISKIQNLNEANVEKTSTFIQKITISLIKCDIISDIQCKISDSYWFQTLSCYDCPKELIDKKNYQNTLPCTAISFKISLNSPNDSQKVFKLDTDPYDTFLFCFLPLPKTANVKFQVNGNFLLTSTREDIVYESNDRIDAFKTKWNENLQKCLSLTLIECCKKMIGSIDFNMFDLMNLLPANCSLKLFEKEFFSQIFNYNLKIPIFKRYMSTFSIDKCKVLKLSFKNDVVNEAENILQEIVGEEFFVVNFPQNIWCFIKENGISIQNTINDFEFCRLFIDNLKMFSKDKIVKIMNYLLSNYTYDFNLSALTDIGVLLRDTSCILTNLRGTFKRPNEMIDTSSVLCDLYDMEQNDVFPNQDIFHTNRKILLKLGLIYEYLPAHMLVERLKAFKPNQTAKFNCWQFLNHYITTLQKETHDTSDSYAHQLIRQTKFIKAKLQANNTKRLEWFSDNKNHMLFSLNELYDENCEWSIFRNRPIFDSAKMSENCKQSISVLRLKMNDQTDTVSQFKDLYNDWQLFDNETKNLLAEELSVYFLKLLNWLAANLGNKNRLDLGLPTKLLFLNINENFDFYNVENFAIEVKYASYPHMMQLPGELNKYKTLMLNLGVKPKFEVNYLLKLLSSLHDNNLRKTMSEKDAELSINIVKELETMIDIQTIREKIYLPDNNLIMRQPEEMCLNDDSSSWLVSDEVCVVNDNVPIGIAKKLGIINLQSHYAKQFMEGFSFGQQEPLIARIKKLLDSYPNFYDIFKELIQNADDAGASQIVFILDTRTHASTKIFSEEFSKLQGPALCCYNNKTFSENDFQALKSLGVGNKANQRIKVGSYGVGFNTVYHLTDAPQILSNLDNYVLFDPLCRHFPSVQSNNPGWRIKIEQNKTKNVFDVYEDVINSFIGCFSDKKELNSGTMFRFALRTETSELSDCVYSIYEIEAKIREQIKQLQDCMIFLKKIQEIKVVKIKLNGQLETIAHYLREFQTTKDETAYLNFIQLFKNTSGQNLELIDHSIHSYDIKIKDLIQSESIDFRIINQIGLKKKIDLAKECNFFPIASIAIPLYIQHNQSFNGSFYCFLPLPLASPLPYHINGYFALVNESRQGLFKLTDMENDKHKWNQSIFNDIISNLILEAIKYIKNTNEQKYIENPDLIESHYMKYFPTFNLDKSWIDSVIYLEDMVTSFYENLLTSNEKLIPVFKFLPCSTIKWFPITDKNLLSSNNLNYFLNEKYETIKYFSHKKYEYISEILVNYGFELCCFLKLINLLNIIYKKTHRFQDIITEINAKHILDYFTNNYNIKGQKIRETFFRNSSNLYYLLSFCKWDAENRQMNWINCLDNVTLLLDGSNVLNEFSKNFPLYLEDDCEIFKSGLNKFIHSSQKYLIPDIFVKKIKINDLPGLLPHALPKNKFFVQENLFSFECFPSIDIQNLTIFSKLLNLIERSQIEKETNNSKQAYKDCVRESLEPISNWALIPVKFDNSEDIFAAPMSALKIIIKYSYYAMPTFLIDFFKRCNLPQVAICNTFLESIIMNTSETSDIIETLKLIFENKKQLFESLDSKLRIEFLKHVFGKYDLSSDSMNKLMSLPLYENVFGEILSINNKSIIILYNDTAVPLCGLKKIFPSSNYFLAIYNESVSKLYQYLTQIMSFLQFYKTYLNNLNDLEYEEKYEHILAIKDSRYHLDNDILGKLKNFAFIKSDASGLLTASNFYNPRVKLLKILLNSRKNVFPSEPYNTDQWLSFLRDIGLKGKEIFEQYQSIVEYLELSKTLYNSDLIKFDELIFVHDELYACIRQLSKFETIEPILLNFDKSIQFFTDSVNDNLEGTEDKNSIKSVFIKLYNILKNFYENYKTNAVMNFFEKIRKYNLIFHEFEIDSIKKWKLDPIDKFVENNLRKFEQIENHLYIYPSYLAEYKYMFARLGLNSEVTYDLCVKISSRLYKEQYHENNALKLMDLLFETSSNNSKDSNFDLYLLNGEFKLIRAKDLYYIDKDYLFYLYNTEFRKKISLISLDEISDAYSYKYKLYNNNWNSLIKKLKPEDRPTEISSFISKKTIVDKTKLEKDQELEEPIHDELFIKSIKILLNCENETGEFEDFFLKMQFYKADNIVTNTYFRDNLIENTQIEERFSTEFNNVSKSFTFYRSTSLPYATYSNLFQRIKEGLFMYFSEFENKICSKTEASILELLLSKKSFYESILLEHKKFLNAKLITDK